MKKIIKIAFIACIVANSLSGYAQMQVERLTRGHVAVRKSQGYFISWRLLADEPWNQGFNLYRGTTKLNDAPIVSVTSYYDSIATQNSLYYVRAVVDGKEVPDAKYARIINTVEGSNAGYFDINLSRPATGSNGGTYSPGDASAGDLTGDGEYEIVLKWDPSNAKDNSQSGTTDNVFLDAYTLKGTLLWRIDLGPNIRAGAHYTQFLVFDFDGNGRSEIMVKTAPGTKDASGNYISKGPAATTNHTTIYRNSSGYILSGPEYITVFDGATGLELATDNYWPLRGAVSSWGDNYGNRLDRYNATVAYVDGKRPTAIFQRGYYTRHTMAAWDWRDGKLTRRWTFDSSTSGNGNYYGQGNHSIHVIDANGDGKQDIITGASVISGNGTGLHTTGFGHGDACHVTYMKKNDTRPMIYMPHESGGNGVLLRYADNGQHVFNNRKDGDIGRGACAELDANRPGFHFWASGMGLYDITGKVVGSNPNSCNFVIWWDGQLSRELMNGNTIDKWNIASNTANRLLTGTNAGSINGTKSTPVLQADLFGDWREEVILRRNDNLALRVYTSMMPTNYRLYTFMHDPTYRVAVSWQNSSYNQPPHPGYYVASDMDFPPVFPSVQLVEGYNRGSGKIVTELMVYDVVNAAKWEVMSDLRTNVSIYGDKTFYASGLPDYLIGKEWIRTTFDSKNYTVQQNAGVLKVKEDAVISIIHPIENQESIGWLASFEKKTEMVTMSVPGSAPVTMFVYEKKLSAGSSLLLGENASSDALNDMMYFVVARNFGEVGKTVQNQNNSLLKVFPNPANSLANIRYSLNAPDLVHIELFDFNGKVVMQLANEFKQTGTHTLSFDTAHLPAGMYMVRLKTGNESQMQKIAIIK